MVLAIAVGGIFFREFWPLTWLQWLLFLLGVLLCLCGVVVLSRGDVEVRCGGGGSGMGVAYPRTDHRLSQHQHNEQMSAAMLQLQVRGKGSRGGEGLG